MAQAFTLDYTFRYHLANSHLLSMVESRLITAVVRDKRRI